MTSTGTELLADYVDGTYAFKCITYLRHVLSLPIVIYTICVFFNKRIRSYTCINMNSNNRNE